MNYVQQDEAVPNEANYMNYVQLDEAVPHEANYIFIYNYIYEAVLHDAKYMNYLHCTARQSMSKHGV